MSKLDCLVIGYNDDTNLILDKIQTLKDNSLEKELFKRNYLLVDNTPLTYIDVINHFTYKSPQWPDKYALPFYHVGEVSNLAAVYLANYLLERGFYAKQISLFSAQQTELLQLLETENPTVVAITTTFYEQTQPVTEIVQFVKEHAPKSLIVVGGPLIDNLVHDLNELDLRMALQEMEADIFVCEAQGELALCQLLQALSLEQDLTSVPNLIVRNGDQFRSTHKCKENNALDECAINWDNFDDEVVGSTVQTRTARSCAYACAFCDYPVRAGKLTLASIDTVENELKKLHRRAVKNIVFIDDTFNVPHERFRELCKMMIRNRFEFKWFSYFRCSSVKDTDIFKLMKDSGCCAVFLGIESGDSRVLKNMNKVATPEQYFHGMEQLHRNEIITFASFICGFPGETQTSIQNTLDFINTAQPTLFRVEPWWYHHRSPIVRQRDEFKISGQGYNWRHSTMGIKEACDGADFIYSNAQYSWWCPQQSFSFWALPYLFGKGMLSSELIRFLELCHRLLPFNNSAPTSRQKRLEVSLIEAQLGDLIQSSGLTAPRFILDQKSYSLEAVS